MALQLRRGTDAERVTITPAAGELLYTTDTHSLYVGDGTTAGGIAASSAGGGGNIPGGDSSGAYTLWIGTDALPNHSSIGNTVAIGGEACYLLANSGGVAAFGSHALRSNLRAGQQTAIGTFALGAFGKPIPSSDIQEGYNYEIVDAGSFDFTTIGAANSNPGTRFNATGPGTSGQVCSTEDSNVAVGCVAGGGHWMNNASVQGWKNVFLGAFTTPLNSYDHNSIVIGGGATGLGSNTTMIGNDGTTLTQVAGKLRTSVAPASVIGAAGDKAGMICADANHLYHCVADYDGTTSIWRRVTGSTW